MDQRRLCLSDGWFEGKVVSEWTYSNSGVVGVLQAETLYCWC